MSLCYRERPQLRGIEVGLFRSGSHLVEMLETFGRLYSGQDMPVSERVLAGLAISILVGAALTPPPRSGAPASGHRPPSLSAPGRAALYGVLAEIESLGLELLEVRRLRPR